MNSRRPAVRGNERRTGGACRVMVIEDDRTTRRSSSDTVRCLGHGTHVVTRPSEALLHAPRYRPDVILLDLGLLHAHAQALARQLRAVLGNVRILGLTRDERPWAPASCPPFDGYLGRPVAPEVLRGYLDTQARARAVRDGALSFTSQPARRSAGAPRAA